MERVLRSVREGVLENALVGLLRNVLESSILVDALKCVPESALMGAPEGSVLESVLRSVQESILMDVLKCASENALMGDLGSEEGVLSAAVPPEVTPPGHQFFQSVVRCGT
jgi:hypothetical protein